MPRDHQHNPDSNVNAARNAGQTAGEADKLPDNAQTVKVNHYPPA